MVQGEYTATEINWTEVSFSAQFRRVARIVCTKQTSWQFISSHLHTHTLILLDRPW